MSFIEVISSIEADRNRRNEGDGSAEGASWPEKAPGISRTFVQLRKRIWNRWAHTCSMAENGVK